MGEGGRSGGREGGWGREGGVRKGGRWGWEGRGWVGGEGGREWKQEGEGNKFLAHVYLLQEDDPRLRDN